MACRLRTWDAAELLTSIASREPYLALPTLALVRIRRSHGAKARRTLMSLRTCVCIADMSINMLSQSPFRHHPRVTLLLGFHEVSTCLRFAPTGEARSTWTWLDRTSRCRAATYFGVSWGCRMRAARQRSCSDFSVGHGTASRMAASF